MKFTKATIKAIRANIAGGDILLTFRVSLDELEVAQELANYADKDDARVDLEVLPDQPALFNERKR